MRAWVLSLLVLAGCEYEDIYYVPISVESGQFPNAQAIFAYLDNKTMVMEGERIPSHPNGYSENVNFGQATQCYQKVTMTAQSRRITVVSKLGTLVGAPSSGDQGTCDHSMMTNELSFDSTAMLIENVRDDGACFDITITYPGFGQEGRGSIAADGKTLTLELFFKDQATGHRCADGDVGDATVTIRQNPFSGDARQVYEVM